MSDEASAHQVHRVTLAPTLSKSNQCHQSGLMPSAYSRIFMPISRSRPPKSIISDRPNGRFRYRFSDLLGFRGPARNFLQKKLSKNGVHVIFCHVPPHRVFVVGLPCRRSPVVKPGSGKSVQQHTWQVRISAYWSEFDLSHLPPLFHTIYFKFRIGPLTGFIFANPRVAFPSGCGRYT